MPRRFGRLPFFTRRLASDRASRDPSALEGARIDPDAAPVGPVMLLPAMIYHQVLIDSTEMEPAWLRPRSGPEHGPGRLVTSAAAERARKPAPSTDKAPTPKATRQRKTGAKPAAPKPAARKPAATRKPRGPSSGRQTSK
jgi:hypothetical protein